jgi:hypothetical protein
MPFSQIAKMGRLGLDQGIEKIVAQLVSYFDMGP